MASECVLETMCYTDADCDMSANEYCDMSLGMCIVNIGCMTDDECAFNETCSANICMPTLVEPDTTTMPYGCMDDSECAFNEMCSAGICMPMADMDMDMSAPEEEPRSFFQNMMQFFMVY